MKQKSLENKVRTYTEEELFRDGFNKIITPLFTYMIKRFENKDNTRYVVLRLNEETGKYELHKSIKYEEVPNHTQANPTDLSLNTN